MTEPGVVHQSRAVITSSDTHPPSTLTINPIPPPHLPNGKRSRGATDASSLTSSTHVRFTPQQPDSAGMQTQT
ncbi:unnamed protein product [Pleuronectes platessa]|uniref:Uncharacterized protein n=1 Tax=Pleuronectes platessa TaxID=8262 RepID=A0A9N7UZ67_PLEPL|nr:unnamed protein product [Pleuronectes platessa]